MFENGSRLYPHMLHQMIFFYVFKNIVMIIFKNIFFIKKYIITIFFIFNNDTSMQFKNIKNNFK